MGSTEYMSICGSLSQIYSLSILGIAVEIIAVSTSAEFWDFAIVKSDHWLLVVVQVCLVGVLRQWWLLSTSCSSVCLIYCNWKDDPFGRRGNAKLLSKQTNRYPSNSVVVWAIKIKFCQDEPICPGMNWTFLLSFLVVFLNKDVNFFQPLSHDAFNPFRLRNLLPPHRTAQERVLPFSVPERKLEGSRSASCHYLTEWGIHVEDQSSCFSKEHSEEREAKTWSCKKGHLNSEWLKKKSLLMKWLNTGF